MKIIAHQYDTIDAICWRYYGRTQGMTEKVLAANPRLAEAGPFLKHGTEVNLPDVVQAVTTQMVQLWD